jgi:hypothetical protein
VACLVCKTPADLNEVAAIDVAPSSLGTLISNNLNCFYPVENLMLLVEGIKNDPET